jgi:hypothetical protein
MIAWVNTPLGDGALVAFVHDNRDDIVLAIVVIDKRFRAIMLAKIEWLRWPE